MRVVYEKSIFEKVEEAKEEAKREGKKIERIILSRKEWGQLKGECVLTSPLSYETPLGISGILNGVHIEVEADFSKMYAKGLFIKK